MREYWPRHISAGAPDRPCVARGRRCHASEEAVDRQGRVPSRRTAIGGSYDGRPGRAASRKSRRGEGTRRADPYQNRSVCTAITHSDPPPIRRLTQISTTTGSCDAAPLTESCPETSPERVMP